MEKRKGMVKGRGMLKGRGTLKGRGNEKEKGDGEKGRGMEKRRGMVKGRAYLGPHCRSLVVLDPRHCLHTCVLVVLSLGCVTSLSSCVSWLCHHWAVLPHHRRRMSGCVIVVPCPPCRVVVLSWLHHAVSLSLPSHVIVGPLLSSV